MRQNLTIDGARLRGRCEQGAQLPRIAGDA
jgi:hypothetical protein